MKKKDNTGKFLEKIETLKITKEQKDILADRIRRKLILSDKQLVEGGIRYELAEAKGIDYTRKVRLCQYAIDEGGSFLELSTGADNTLLMKPTGMKKEGNDLLLMGEEIPDGSPVQVPLRKLRLVRKLRTSLMG